MSVAKIPSQGETTRTPPPKALMTVLGTLPLTLGHQWVSWADVKNRGEGFLPECGCFSLEKKNPHWEVYPAELRLSHSRTDGDFAHLSS